MNCTKTVSIATWLLVASRTMAHTAAGILTALFLMPSTALADNAWSIYQWGRTGDHAFVLKLGDNVSGVWDDYTHLETASTDLSASSVLDTLIVAGGTSPRRCKATSGRVEVCNSRYGFNGWLGIAQIWISSSHITQSVVKMNDSYFNSATYGTTAWRNMVMCQEIGHAFGLDHQDVDFNNANLGSCMDYTSDPESNQHPDSHDYAQLETIYDHFDSVDTFDYSTGDPVEEEPPACKGGWKKCGNGAKSPGINELVLNEPGQWGKLVSLSRGGRQAIYDLDLGDGHRILTHVFWVEE